MTEAIAHGARGSSGGESGGAWTAAATAAGGEMCCGDVSTARVVCCGVVSTCKSGVLWRRTCVVYATARERASCAPEKASVQSSCCNTTMPAPPTPHVSCRKHHARRRHADGTQTTRGRHADDRKGALKGASDGLSARGSSARGSSKRRA
jgi:hypothetical protein